MVSTPASGLVKMSPLCARCTMEVKVHKYKVNLICLPLQGLEVIFGMDWLSANHILIDCREKRLSFPNLEEPELLSSQGVMKEMQEGAQCYTIFTHLEVEKEEGCLFFQWCTSLKMCSQKKYHGCFPIERWSSLLTWYLEPVQCRWLHTVWP